MTDTPAIVRRTEAYKQLGISYEQIRAATPITSQIRMMAKKLKQRNLPTSPYYYLKCSGDADARKVIDLYYSLPKSKRDLVPIEGYCVAAGIHPVELFEIIVLVCRRVSSQASAMIAAISHPQVVEKTVEMALTDDGFKDRVVLHKAIGFLPTPKTAQTNISVTQTAQASAASATVAAPAPENTIRRLADRFHEVIKVAPALPAEASVERVPQVMPKDALVAVPVDVDDEEDEE